MKNQASLSISELRKKHVIITGASKGLGSVLSSYFIEQGAQVCLMARSIDKMSAIIAQAENPQLHLALAVDFLNLDEVKKAATKALEFFKNDVDIILHCAGGGLGLKDPFLGVDDLNKLYMLNLGAAVEINHQVIPFMIEKRKGNLVHVGSIAATEAVGSVGYNTVKTGLNAYVKSFGREIAKHNIIATGINPGGFFAPENAMVRMKNNNPEALDNFITTRLPRGFMGEAKELVPMIHLLCTDGASMMSGCMVSIDAGEGKAY